MNAYPIFRLVMFLAAGIFCADTFRLELGIYPVAGLLFLLVLLGVLLKSPSYKNRWLFGVVVSCFMFGVGWILTSYAWKEVVVDWPTERKEYAGVLQDTPIEKPRTYQCRVNVEDKDVLLFLSKDSLAASLEVGDELHFYTRIESPRNRDSLRTFDYARYLLRKGISGTAYLPAYAWEKVEKTSTGTLKQQALLVRERLMDKYRQWGIGDGQMPVLSALTLGYKGDLDKETREAFSVAGISHVLALSGMHIAVVWLLLNGVLSPLVRGKIKWLKWVVVSVALWAFAFMVGLEASVVRAVVMCMLVELGRLAGARPLSMNTLSIAAFFMLLYHPFYLFDVGFQLSFVAVASILLFYPMLFGCLSAGNRVVRWVGGVMSVSLAAQLGTAPLVMYYFSNFSVYFLLTNLVAAFCVPIIIGGCFLLVVLCCWPMLQGWVAVFLNSLVSVLNVMAEWTSGLPYATVSLSVVKPVELVAFYVCLAFGWKYAKTRRRKWLIGLMAACACLLALHLCFVWYG